MLGTWYLTPYLHNTIYKILQSGFRPHCSNDKVLVKVVNVPLLVSDQGCTYLLGFHDLTTAFDTSITEDLRSHLTDSYQFLNVNGMHKSKV